MVFIEGTLTADATPASTVKAAIETALGGITGWTEVDTGVVASSVTYDVWESAAASNEVGADWYLFIGVDAAETSLYFAAAEDWNTGTEQSVHPVYSNTNPSTTLDADGYPNITPNPTPLTDTDFYKTPLLFDVVLDKYAATLSINHVAVLGRADTSALCLYAGFYERYITSSGLDDIPLVCGGFEFSGSDSGKNLRFSNFSAQYNGGSKTSIVDDSHAAVDRLTTAVFRNDNEHFGPGWDPSADTDRVGLGDLVTGGRAFLIGVQGDNARGYLHQIYGFGEAHPDFLAFDTITIGAVDYMKIDDSVLSAWMKAT